MAVPDAEPGADQPRRRIQPEFMCATLAVLVAAAAVGLWVVELGTGHVAAVSALTIAMWVVSAVLVVAWLVTSAERRLIVHLRRIEGARYRDGFADGYIEATNRRNGNHYERPNLRPVK